MTLSKLLSQPTQYKLGWTEFYKLRFRVNKDVLIPRPETELLVDAVLLSLRGRKSERLSSDVAKQSITILDVGTGTGNIAISLACNLKGCNVNIIATDISESALKVAEQNAKLHGVEDKINFIQSNLLNVIPANAGIQLTNSRSELDPRLRGDDNLILVTNLPYIPSARIPYLDSSVKDFEPHIALDGGNDGFDLYRKLFAQINKLGWEPKLIIGEIDYTQGKLAQTEAKKYFPNAKVEVKLDLARKIRILKIMG